MGVLLAIIVFFLIPLAKNSNRLTPEWRAVALLTLAGTLILSTKIWKVAQKELFLEKKTTTQDPINAKAKKLKTLIMQGKVEELQTLLEDGELDLKLRASQQDWPILHLLTIAACQHKDFLPLLKQALKQKEILLNLAGISGFTPLHLAAYIGNQEVCKLLIEAGANPSTKQDQGQNPWQLAWEKGHKKLAVYLYKACRIQDKKTLLSEKIPIYDI